MQSLAKKSDNKIENLEAALPFLKRKLNDMEARIDHVEEIQKSKQSEIHTPAEFVEEVEISESSKPKVDEEQIH